MDAVLIYKEQNHINQEQTALTAYVAYLQKAYDAFLAIGIETTIEEAYSVIFQCNNHQNQGWGGDYMKNFVVDKLLDKAGDVNYNGVSLQREKLKDIITIPDLTDIKNIASQWQGVKRGGVAEGIRTNLLTLTDGVIAKANNADSTIDAMYSHYTKNDAGVQCIADILAVIAAINTFDAAHDNAWTGKYTLTQQNASYVGSGGIYPGIMMVNGQLVPALNYVREWEAKHA